MTRAAVASLALLLGVALAGAAAAQEAPFRPLGKEPAAAPAVRVYVVRHAQAWKNVPSVLRPPGMTDAKLDSLTEKGQQQARAVGERLAGAGVTRVVSSPAQRARQTAEAIAGVLGAGPVEVSESFEPLRHGTSKQAADYRWRTGNWKAGADPRPEGGEALEDGLARAAGFLENVAREAPGTTLVVVTHGEIAAALLSKAAGISPLAGYQAHFVDEGTISDVGVSVGEWHLYAKGVRP
jgi:probable phosphoglycerate mutase